MPESVQEKPDSKETATEEANRILESYELFDVPKQLDVAKQIGVDQKLIQDVRAAQFVLHDLLLTGNYSAAKLRSCTKDLAGKLDDFSQALKRIEKGNNASATERIKGANLRAKLLLTQYDVASVDEQLKISQSIGVAELLVGRLKKIKYLVDVHTSDSKATGVEREAVVTKLENTIQEFDAATRAVEKTDSRRTEQRLLAARRRAHDLLRDFRENKIAEKMEVPDPQVNRELLQRLRSIKFLLEDRLNSGNYSATQLEAITIGLQRAVNEFLLKLDKIQSKKSDEKRLKSLERELDR